MANRSKHEVSTARTRLDATLQSLVDRKDDPADESLESDSETPFSIDFLTSGDSPASSPSKRNYVYATGISNKGRKRKRKEDVVETDTGGHHHAYVMKLFDRSVDLAQFNENSSLYSIARAWISNKASEEERSPSPEVEPQSQEEVGESGFPNVYQLPPPIKLKIEYGVPNTRDPRIPPLIPSKEKPLDIYADPDLGPPPEDLLLRHMDRWKRIRNTWCNAARINELKFSNSMAILKTMYERQLQSEPNYEG